MLDHAFINCRHPAGYETLGHPMGIPPRVRQLEDCSENLEIPIAQLYLLQIYMFYLDFLLGLASFESIQGT
jgi:hypothetical protein